jgi:hypothetical protein
VSRAIRAGLGYVAVVFALGFALGTLRVLVIAPRLGETGAVVIELPAMLAASWAACRALVRRFAVPSATAPLLAMGGLAFAALLALEAAVGVLGFGRTLAEHLATYRAPGAQLGLAAQLAFAAMPLVVRR